MKKVLCVVVAAALVAGLLVGCGEKDPETAPAPCSSGITCDEILENFEVMLEPIADQLRLTRLPQVELEDGRIYQPVVVTDTLLARNYHLGVYYTEAGDAEALTLGADMTSRTELNFAIFSFYLYKSLNLPEVEAQEFYDSFSMLSEAPEGRMPVEGWELWVFCRDDLLTFSARYAPK